MVRKTSDLKWIKEIDSEYRYCDITDHDLIPETVKSADVIIHNAGVVRAKDPATYYAINQIATKKIVENILQYNPTLKSFIYISSQAAMGPSSCPRPKPLDEPERPVSDYGRSKLAAEKEVEALRGKIPFTILRPASIYGPRDKDIFIFFKLVSLGLRPRPVKERFIQLLYVKDLAAAALKAIETPAANGKTYYLADETPYSWDGVGKAIAAAVGKRTMPLPLPDLAFHAASLAAEAVSALSGKPAVLNRQKIDEMLQPYWLGDPSPARKELGLDFTKLNFGAKITYLWYKENRWL